MMSRKRIALLAMLLCVVVAGAVLAATGGISVYVKGQPIAAQAIVQHGQVYLPVRAISDALDISVEWDPTARAVYVGGRAKAPARTQKIQDIVHITRTGTKYHRAGCRYLSRSDIPISREDAIARGLTPCKVCKP
jgi:hypothetical protein